MDRVSPGEKGLLRPSVWMRFLAGFGRYLSIAYGQNFDPEYRVSQRSFDDNVIRIQQPHHSGKGKRCFINSVFLRIERVVVGCGKIRTGQIIPVKRRTVQITVLKPCPRTDSNW